MSMLLNQIRLYGGSMLAEAVAADNPSAHVQDNSSAMLSCKELELIFFITCV